MQVRGLEGHGLKPGPGPRSAHLAHTETSVAQVIIEGVASSRKRSIRSDAKASLIRA